VDGKVTDLGKFAEFGNRGVDVFPGRFDQRRTPGVHPVRREVGLAFEEIFREARRRVVVACSPSNVHRFQQVINNAVKFKRKLGVAGPEHGSMEHAHGPGSSATWRSPDRLWLKWTTSSPCRRNRP